MQFKARIRHHFGLQLVEQLAQKSQYVIIVFILGSTNDDNVIVQHARSPIPFLECFAVDQ